MLTQVGTLGLQSFNKNRSGAYKRTRKARLAEATNGDWQRPTSATSKQATTDSAGAQNIWDPEDVKGGIEEKWDQYTWCGLRRARGSYRAHVSARDHPGNYWGRANEEAQASWTTKRQSHSGGHSDGDCVRWLSGDPGLNGKIRKRTASDW